jgi:hypothetical protein
LKPLRAPSACKPAETPPDGDKLFEVSRRSISCFPQQVAHLIKAITKEISDDDHIGLKKPQKKGSIE